jgi:hypothetical protein
MEDNSVYSSSEEEKKALVVPEERIRPSTQKIPEAVKEEECLYSPS